MKIFFDTNAYIAEALLGKASEAMLRATIAARWKIFINEHVLEEIESVLVTQLRFSPRYAKLTRARCRRRAEVLAPPISRHQVSEDPDDSPILQAAISAGLDYLVTNDAHLLKLNPYQGLKIVSMTEYQILLEDQDLL